MGSAASAQQWHCAQTLLGPREVPKGGRRKRRAAPFTPSCLHCSFTVGSSGCPASPSHLQALPWPHFLPPPHPPTEMGLFVKQKDWLLLVKYFKMVCVCIWKWGNYFPKKSQFSKCYRKLFLREIHNCFWNFLHLQSLPCRGVSSTFLHKTFNICIHFLFKVRKRSKPHRC